MIQRNTDRGGHDGCFGGADITSFWPRLAKMDNGDPKAVEDSGTWDKNCVLPPTAMGQEADPDLPAMITKHGRLA